MSRARSAHVITHCGLVLRMPAPAPDRDERLLYLGDDQEGQALEVVAVETEDGGILVIHAMRMRPRYRIRYDEARPWRI